MLDRQILFEIHDLTVNFLFRRVNTSGENDMNFTRKFNVEDT